MDLRPYYYEDYYPLVFNEDMTTDDIWLAYQLYRPADDAGVIVAFRRELCPDETITVQLSAVNPKVTYKLTDRDSGETFIKTGEALRNGLTLKLEQPRSSLIYHYERVAE